MFDPGQRRYADLLRSKRFRYGAAAALAPALLCLGSATAWADESIVIDFVRHGETTANAAGIIDTVPPGAALNSTGELQAEAVAQALSGQYGNSITDIYSSDELRAIETADYLTGIQGMPALQTLPGLDEINAGIYEGQPVDSLDGILYLLAPISWTLGNEFVPIPGSPDVNGVAFDERFSEAVQAIYGNTLPTVVSNPTDVAFTSEGAMTVWTMMNVNNPDFALLFTELLKTGQFVPNTGQIVVEGNPQDGWTLVSFDGQAVPAASLPTELFVDLRNLVEAPQFAAYNIYEALLTGNQTTITDAIDAGLTQVTSATENFPVAVFDDIVNALGLGTTTATASLATDLAALF